MSYLSGLFKGITATLTGGVIWLLGGWDMVLQILILMIAVDYATGVLWSASQGKLSSKVAFKGINKKIYMLFLVVIAVQMDQLTGSTGVLRFATCSFYISMEMISVIENVGRAGLPIPKILTKAVEVFKDQTDQG